VQQHREADTDGQSVDGSDERHADRGDGRKEADGLVQCTPLAKSSRSLPAVKTSPTPVTTTAPMPVSASAAANASAMVAYMA